jgi:hypothetical protein
MNVLVAGDSARNIRLGARAAKLDRVAGVARACFPAAKYETFRGLSSQTLIGFW